MIYLLDTSALLAHHRQESGWEQVQAIFADGAEILIASVTIAEFARRMRELGAGEPGIRDTLADYRLLFSEVIAVDGAVAWTAFQLWLPHVETPAVGGRPDRCGGAVPGRVPGPPRRASGGHPRRTWARGRCQLPGPTAVPSAA